MPRYPGLLCISCLMALLGLVAGCKSDPKIPGLLPTHFTSEPSGAVVEVNGVYVGDTPFDYPLPQSSGGVARNRVNIRVTPPPGPGLHVHQLQFKGPMHPFDTNQDPVPDQLHFDLRQAGDGATQKPHR